MYLGGDKVLMKFREYDWCEVYKKWNTKVMMLGFAGFDGPLTIVRRGLMLDNLAVTQSSRL